MGKCWVRYRTRRIQLRLVWVGLIVLRSVGYQRSVSIVERVVGNSLLVELAMTNNIFRKLEDSLYWWLERRWRHRATLQEIKIQRMWLKLDESIKRREEEERVGYGI